MKPLRFAGVKLQKLVDSFGLELSEDRVDCQVGVPLLVKPNGRFIIAQRHFDPTTSILSLTLTRDKSSRKSRRK